jgi:hypothetical protein
MHNRHKFSLLGGLCYLKLCDDNNPAILSLVQQDIELKEALDRLRDIIKNGEKNGK